MNTLSKDYAERKIVLFQHIQKCANLMFYPYLNFSDAEKIFSKSTELIDS